jgi:hypothetical protein
MSETISDAGQRARRRIAIPLLPLVLAVIPLLRAGNPVALPKEIAAPEPVLAEKS